MKQTILSEYLSSLNHRDAKDLLIFANLSLSGIPMTKNENGNRKLELFNILIKKSLHSNNKTFNEGLFVKKYILPKDNWNRLKNFYVTTLKRYILYKYNNEKSVLNSLFFIDFFDKHSMPKSLSKIRNEITKNELPQQKELNYHWVKFMAYNSIVSGESKFRKEIPEFELMKNSLNILFAKNTMRILSSELNNRFILNIDKRDSYESISDSFFKENDSQLGLINSLPNVASIPLVNVYNNFFLFLKGEILFDEFLKKITKSNLNGSLDETHEIFNHLLNYCIRKFNTGERIYAFRYVEISTLVENMYGDNFIHECLDPTQISNLVTMKLIIKDVDSAENYYDKYLKGKDEMNDIFMEAKIAFYKEKFDIVIQCLLHYSAPDSLHDLVKRKMTIKAKIKLRVKNRFIYSKEEIRSEIQLAITIIKNKKNLSLEIKNRETFFLRSVQQILKGKIISMDELKQKLSSEDRFWLKGIQSSAIDYTKR